MKKGVAAVANPSVSNYFELLALPKQFELDDKQLRDVYLQMQRVCHPDQLARKGATERIAAMQMSADMNAAYLTLKDPLKRAEYLLLLEGVTVGSEEGAIKPSQMLLMESMELREGLMETDNAKGLSRIADDAAEKLAQYKDDFAAHYTQKNMTKAAEAAIGWRLTAKFASEINAKQKSITAT